MGKKKAQQPASRVETAADGSAGWTINSQSAIVTIWESRDATGSPIYAVTFNRNREPVRPADDEKGARSVMLAFQSLERSDTLKKSDSIGIE